MSGKEASFIRHNGTWQVDQSKGAIRKLFGRILCLSQFEQFALEQEREAYANPKSDDISRPDFGFVHLRC